MAPLTPPCPRGNFLLTIKDSTMVVPDDELAFLTAAFGPGANPDGNAWALASMGPAYTPMLSAVPVRV